MAFHENSSLMFVLQDAAANLHPFARRRQQRRARPRAPPRVLARAHLSLAKVLSERGVGEGFLSQLKSFTTTRPCGGSSGPQRKLCAVAALEL